MAKHQFYTTNKISINRERTPEGFLLIRGSPIARTGEQIYGPDEVPVEVGPDGIVVINRDADQVFRPETMASFHGKSLVNEHPSEDVNPENWRELTHGIIFNPRQGEGADDDLLLVDILVTTAEGIELVESGKTEMSSGYEAEYVQVAPGKGRQEDIVGNHVALVGSGRCGPRCSINDHSNPKLKELHMAGKTKPSLAVILGKAFKAKTLDEALQLGEEMEGSQVADNGGTGEQHIHVHMGGATGGGEGPNGTRSTVTEDDEEEAPGWFKTHVESNNKRFEAIEKKLGEMGKTDDSESEEEKAAREKKEKEEGKTADEEVVRQVEDEAPEGLREMAAKANDSAYLTDSFRETVSLAEILAPGIGIKTFDHKAAPKDTANAIHDMRCRALDAAYKDPNGRVFVEGILGNKTLDTKRMTRDAVRVVFRGAALNRKQANSIGTGSTQTRDGADAKTGITTLADLNRRNREFHAARSK